MTLATKLILARAGLALAPTLLFARRKTNAMLPAVAAAELALILTSQTAQFVLLALAKAACAPPLLAVTVSLMPASNAILTGQI